MQDVTDATSVSDVPEYVESPGYSQVSSASDSEEEPETKPQEEPEQVEPVPEPVSEPVPETQQELANEAESEDANPNPKKAKIEYVSHQELKEGLVALGACKPEDVDRFCSEEELADLAVEKGDMLGLTEDGKLWVLSGTTPIPPPTAVADM